MTGKPTRTVSVIMTVRNDPQGAAVTLSSLARQTRRPDEVVVVDGGSTDETPRVLRQYQNSDLCLRIVEAPGANIARGRNIATRAAAGNIIAVTDAGCRARPDWLEELIRPFEREDHVEFVAGYYEVDAHGLFETVVGLATMRGGLADVDPVKFNPSARSMAMTRQLWERAGGWPEWVRFSEDTLFDHKVRAVHGVWRFAKDAVVAWRPRTTWWSLARQFYHYGTGRGHTQIEREDFQYNLRNAGLVLTCALGGLLIPPFLILAALFAAYFYFWNLSGPALAVARKCGRWTAFPLCLVILWVVMASHTCGYLVGSWQRWRDRARYQFRTETYMTAGA